MKKCRRCNGAISNNRWQFLLVSILTCLVSTSRTMALASVDDDDMNVALPVKASRYDPLAKWLWDLQIDIPDQHFKESIFSLSILSMVCTNFAVEAINSTYIPSSEHEEGENATTTMNPAMDLNVAGITASCSGKYKSAGLSGKMSATITSPQQQALGMRLDFITEQHNSTRMAPKFNMATALSIQDCQVHLKVSKLHFSGSISAKFINLFQKEIRGYVSGALAKQLCPALKDIMDDSFTKLIQQADQYMLGLISDDDVDQDEEELDDIAAALTHRRRMEGLLLPTKMMPSSSDWIWNQDAPLIVTILHVVNMFLDRYLDQGFFVDAMKLIGLLDDAADENDCGYFYHGVNGLLHTLTGGRIEFSIPESLHALQNITFEIPHYASISIMTKMVSIDGVDQLDHLTLLQPSGGLDDSFWSKLQAAEGLNLTAALNIQVAAIPGGAFSGDPLLESFHLSINTTSLDVSGNLTLNFNRTRFEKTTLNHMINGINDNQADVGCCFYPIEKFGVEELLATVGMQSISIIPNENDDRNAILEGSLERDIDGMLNSFLSLFLTEYHTFVTLALSGLLNGPAKDAAEKTGNAWLHNLVHDLKANDTSCEISGIINAPTALAADYLNFSNAKILDKLNHFLNNTQTLGDANKYLGCISNVVEAQVEAQTPTLEYAGASLQLQSVVVKDTDSLQSIELLSPQADGSHLSSSLEFGACTSTNTSLGEDSVHCKRPRVEATTAISVASMNLTGTVNLTASVGSFRDSISALLLVDLNQLRNLTMAKLVSCHTCFLQPVAEAVLYAAPQVFHQLSLEIDAEIASEATGSIGLELNSAEYNGAISKLKSIISWTQMSIVDSINRIVARTSTASQAKCGRDDQGGDAHTQGNEKLGDTISIIVYLLPLYILSHILYMAYCQLKSQRRSYEPLFEFQQRLDNEGVFANLREKDSSLMTKEKVSSALRHTFPVVLIGTIALLIVSNLSVGASVDLSISTADTPYAFRLPSLFAFSLGNTIQEMYHGGIYVLLFIVVIFSGIWPYLKLLMMMWGWMAPESVFSVKKRGKLLFSLDALSKFSLVDTFVLVIMMVSFRFHLAIGDSAIIDVFVNPLFGFYGFLTATTVSLLAGHVELHVHRQSTSSESASEDQCKASLFSHVFTIEGKRYMFSSALKTSLMAIMATTLALLAAGSVLDSFTFEFGGLTGLLLGDDSTKTYSLVSIGTSLPESVEDPSGPGIMFLQVIYFFYACIMPFTCLLALSVLLVVPMTISQQELWLTAAEVANAWSAIEVFALSIIAALFEISTFASFIVGNKCDIVNQILEDKFDDLLQGDDICYSVTASIGANVCFLLVGVVLNSFVVSKLLRITQVVIQERGEPESEPRVEHGDMYQDENVVHRWAHSKFGKYMLVEEDEALPLTEPLLSDPQVISEITFL